MAMYFGSIPRYYSSLVNDCFVHGCGEIVPAMTLPAAGQGLAIESYAFLFVAVDLAFTLAFYASAAILLWKGGRQPMSLLAAVAMASFGTSFPSLAAVASQGSPFAESSFMLVAMLGWVSLSLFFFLFPDGFFVPSWTRYVFFLIVAVDAVQLLNRGRTWELLHVPEYVQLLWYVGSTGILIYSQVHRFRKVSPPVERQRTKWVVYGVSIGVVGFIVMSILFDPALNDGSVTTYLALNAVLNGALTAIPITLTMAVLRRRLWNIDPLVNRTLVYASLTVCVVALYAVSVLYLGRLFQTKDNFVVSLLATAVVAVLFAPLKEWLQRRIHRLMKGRHDDPYAVLLELGDQLIRPLPPEAMLDAVVRTVKEALRLPYAGLSIGVGDGGQEPLAAFVGEPAAELHAYPVIHRGERLGTLHIGSRSPGEAFAPEDGKFLDVLLRQAGPIVENVNMTLGMKLLAQDLQHSREKLVLAREEERRRIRNNLHDDLAPRLAALALNAATARKYVEKQPAVAIDMLEDLRQVIRSTVGEIRTMVHDLRPPALDELGLLGAIEERVHELTKPVQLLAEEEGGEPLCVVVEASVPLPALPAAVEVAAYRIVVESVVNVVKHTRATRCAVRLEVRDEGRLTVEIEDDGIAAGGAPSVAKGGIGQQSIRERAAELGGTCAIERSERGGTRVRAVLPFEEGREGSA
jgi:signal transduction histidine kinase